jgi:hypothetical protein
VIYKTFFIHLGLRRKTCDFRGNTGQTGDVHRSGQCFHEKMALSPRGRISIPTFSDVFGYEIER